MNVLPERSEKYGTAVSHTIAAGSVTPVATPINDIAVDGSIDDGEVDLYGFNLVAGQTYIFSVYSSGATPLPDTYMYILDGGVTTILGEDDDGGVGTNSLITYTAAYTGLHAIGVTGFSADQTGGYTLDAVLKPPTDVVGDTFGTAAAYTVGSVGYGYIDAGPDGPYGPGFGEVDTYAFTVEAGLFYTFEVAGGADYASLFFDLPPGELDTVIAIYDSGGNLVASNDDINFGQGDISSRTGFFAETSGTYYLDVFSYQPWSGGFTINSSVADPADFDPLDSINWVSANNIPVDETNTAYVYFAVAGETFGETADNGIDPIPSFGWSATEINAVMQALEEYSKVIGINYEITTDSSEATFRLLTTTSTQYGAYMYPQDPAFGSAQGIAAFNVNSGGWDKDGHSTQNIPGDQVSLLQGGYSFWTLLHEFGHGHGLAHPHDTGGGSDVMLGVTAAQDSYGIYDLNQAVYTVMSYNGSWETGPNGASPFTINGISNGWQGTLSAFDIAMLQARYGASAYATGDDTYTIKDTQGAGTYYETIWDTGGKDAINYVGNRNARIDLTAATIDYSPTGGGVMSFVNGIFGGFTIAAGVVIENASGGDGNDVLIGNSAANALNGNGGDDIMVGRAGADKLDGGSGFDTANYADSGAAVRVTMGNNGSGTGSGGDAAGDTLKNIEAVTGSNFNDTLIGGNSNDTFNGGNGNDNLSGGNGSDTLNGGAGNDQLAGGNGADSLDGGDGNDTLNGGNGADVMAGGAGNDTMDGGNDADTMTGGAGNDTLRGDNGADTLDGGDNNDTLEGGNDNDNLSGGAGVDNLSGGNGVDTLTGGAGNDTLTGGNARDHFVFAVGDGQDLIADFKKNQDLIDVRSMDLDWSDLDSNNNNKLDDADVYVTVSGGDTIIDFGLANGGVSGIDTVRVDNVINLTDDSFLFG